MLLRSFEGNNTRTTVAHGSVPLLRDACHARSRAEKSRRLYRLFGMRVEKWRPLYRACGGRSGNRARCAAPCREMPSGVPRHAEKCRRVYRVRWEGAAPRWPAWYRGRHLVSQAARGWYRGRHLVTLPARVWYRGRFSRRGSAGTGTAGGISRRLGRYFLLRTGRRAPWARLASRHRWDACEAPPFVGKYPGQKSWRARCPLRINGGSTLTRDGRKVTRWNLWQRVPRDLSGCSRMS